MAEAQRNETSLSPVVLDAYLMSVERDDLTLKAQREHVARFKGCSDALTANE